MCARIKEMNVKSQFLVGVTISENVLRALVMRYSDKDGNIRFNDFVGCFIKLKTMTSEDFYQCHYQAFHPKLTWLYSFLHSFMRLV